jgi:hypothetical protein
MNTVQGALDVAMLRKLGELTCPFELQLFKERCIDPETVVLEGAQVIGVDIDSVWDGFIISMRVEDTPTNRAALERIGGELT